MKSMKFEINGELSNRVRDISIIDNDSHEEIIRKALTLYVRAKGEVIKGNKLAIISDHEEKPEIISRIIGI